MTHFVMYARPSGGSLNWPGILLPSKICDMYLYSHFVCPRPSQSRLSSRSLRLSYIKLCNSSIGCARIWSCTCTTTSNAIFRYNVVSEPQCSAAFMLPLRKGRFSILKNCACCLIDELVPCICSSLPRLVFPLNLYKGVL